MKRFGRSGPARSAMAEIVASFGSAYRSHSSSGSRSASRGSGGRPSVLAHAGGVLGSNRLGSLMVNDLSASRPSFDVGCSRYPRFPAILKAGALHDRRLATTGASIYYTELTQKDCLAARLPFDIGQCELGERP
ncbi:hypothetical protein ES703_49881 [subsurface metagenome]|jgi:hypothetical protein